MKQKIALILFLLLLAAVAFLYVVPMIERDRYDFTLKGAGGPVSLSDFRGKKAVAVYFGYTYCPDICPTTFTTLSLAMQKLSEEEAGQMQILFVSVDPRRDTPQSLKEYVEYFYPSFIGVTGTQEQIDEVVRKYEGTAYKFIEEGSDAMGYTVGHTSFVYFFDKQGNYTSILNHSIDPGETVGHMKQALGLN